MPELHLPAELVTRPPGLEGGVTSDDFVNIMYKLWAEMSLHGSIEIDAIDDPDERRVIGLMIRDGLACLSDGRLHQSPTSGQIDRWFALQDRLNA